MITSSSNIQKHIFQILSHLRINSVDGHKKIRVGNHWDGGYVILDDFIENSCCLSIGIGNDVSFDLGLAARGYIIFQFDHTIAETPITNDQFVFLPIGLGDTDDKALSILSLNTMAELFSIKKFNSRLLKIDIEEAEWDALSNVTSELLDVFDQIIIEFHFFRGLENLAFMQQVEKTFQLICRTHAPIHVHGNNGSDYPLVYGVPIPRVIEVSFVKRSRYKTRPSYESLPGPLDYPNNHRNPDYYLGGLFMMEN